jgi:hypothetical protein
MQNFFLRKVCKFILVEDKNLRTVGVSKPLDVYIIHLKYLGTEEVPDRLRCDQERNQCVACLTASLL